MEAVFNDLSGDIRNRKVLEEIASDLRVSGLTGTLVIPFYAVNMGKLTSDSFSLLVSVESDLLYDLYDFVDTHSYSVGLLAVSTAEFEGSSFDEYKKGALSYGF